MFKKMMNEVVGAIASYKMVMNANGMTKEEIIAMDNSIKAVKSGEFDEVEA